MTAAIAQGPTDTPLLEETIGDNLAATFSTELADITIYVIDVSAGDKIPRKGGPGITRSDLLVINKTDLAPLVGADLGIMDRDSKKMRGDKPFLFTNLKENNGAVSYAHLTLPTTPFVLIFVVAATIKKKLSLLESCVYIGVVDSRPV